MVPWVAVGGVSCGDEGDPVMPLDLHPDWRDHALPVAYATARRYRGIVEADDCFQELTEYAIRHWAEVHELIEPSPLEGEDQPSPKHVKSCHRRLNRRLAKVGERYARKIKAQVFGYETRDEFFYTPSMIEELLPLVFVGEHDGSLLNTQDDPTRRRAKQVLSEGNNLPALLADVSGALDALEYESRDLLESIYAPHPHASIYQRREAVSNALGITRWALDGRVDRILARIVAELGGPSPWSGGGRRAVSNAHARAVTARQTDG